MNLFAAIGLGRLRNRMRPARRTNWAGSIGKPGLEVLEDRCLLSNNIISGFVFNDANNNGLFDSGESPLANSTIQLRNASGTVIGTAVTDSSGAYQFTTDSTISTAPTTLTRMASISSAPTDWTKPLSVPQFDPSLGTLTAVDIINGGSFISQIKVESQDGGPSTITATDAGSLTLTGPGVSSLTTTTSTSKTFDASPFDGVIDFGGTSGHDFGSQTATGSTTLTLSAPGVLAAYVGGGTVSFSEVAHATSSAGGAGNLITQIATNATAQVSVVYHYIPSNALRPGNYTLVQINQPTGFLEGSESSNGVAIANSVGSESIAVTLGNADSTNNNFAELSPASLAGFVYVDVNNNGVKDSGEIGISGVTLTLSGTNDLGPVSLTATSGADGSYVFPSLRPGVYTMTETQPPNFLDGKDAVGSLGGTLSNDQVSGVTLHTGVAGANYNFGELIAPSIAGFVYVDANNNGIKDNGEAGIPGATVSLTGTNDLNAPVSLTRTTAADGSYSFQGLRPGTYTVVETQPSTFLDGKDVAGSAGGTLSNDQVSAIVLATAVTATGYNFGELAPASVSGFVFQDNNDDGNKDPGEPGVAGTMVTLTGSDDLGNSVSQARMTAGDGSYSFQNLRPGTYTVHESQPSPYLDGQDRLGSAGGAASNDQFTGLNLVSGTVGANYNFGEVLAGAISGFVYLDSNNDGVKQFSESGIAGVTVTLTGTDDLGNLGRVVQITGSDGSYQFANLRPGSYLVSESQPSQYLNGKITLGSAGGTAGADQFAAISLGSGVHGADYNFGELLPANATGFIYEANSAIFGKPDLQLLSKLLFLNTTPSQVVDPLIQVEATYVDGLYRTILDRPADSPALIAWIVQLQQGVPRLQVVNALWNSPEHRSLEVDQLYAAVLHRSPDAAGRAAWVNALVGGLGEEDMARMLLDSAEYQATHADNASFVTGLYGDVLGRTPTPEELNAAVLALQNGASRDALVMGFLSSREVALRATDQAYQHLLQRDADPAGEQAWVNMLTSGAAGPQWVQIGLMASDEFFAAAMRVALS